MKRFVLTAATVIVLGGGLPAVAPESTRIWSASARQTNDAGDENLDAGSPPVANDASADAAAETLDQGAPAATGDTALVPPPSDANLAPPPDVPAADVTTSAPAAEPAAAQPVDAHQAPAYSAPVYPGPTPVPFPFNNSGGLVVQAGQGASGGSSPLGFDSCDYRVTNSKSFVGVHCELPKGGFPFSGFPFDSAPVSLPQGGFEPGSG